MRRPIGRPPLGPPRPNKIKEARMRRRITQDQLGEMVGLTGSAVARHENHQRHLDDDAVLRYVGILGGIWC